MLEKIESGELTFPETLSRYSLPGLLDTSFGEPEFFEGDYLPSWANLLSDKFLSSLKEKDEPFVDDILHGMSQQDKEANPEIIVKLQKIKDSFKK